MRPETLWHGSMTQRAFSTGACLGSRRLTWQGPSCVGTSLGVNGICCPPPPSSQRTSGGRRCRGTLYKPELCTVQYAVYSTMSAAQCAL